MGIPALEDGLFANLLIFDYLYYIFVFGLSASKMTLAFLIHTLDAPLQTQTHTQECGGAGGGGGGRGGGDSGGGRGGGDGGGSASGGMRRERW